MARFHNIGDKHIPFTAQEEADADDVQTALDASKPMRDWERDMAQSDQLMPRWMEDHIEADHAGVVANPYQQAAYDAKKTLRGNKP